MAAPTNTLTNGSYTITATGEDNGVLIPTNSKVLNPVLTIGCSGTFTSLVLAIRSRITGLTNFFPVPVLKQTDNSVPSNSASISLTNSTNVAFQLSIAGYDETEVYAASGTPTSLVIEANITSGNGSAPITVAVNAAGAGAFTNVTASGTLAVTGATTLTGAAALNGGTTSPDSATTAFGDASDITMTWNGTNFVVAQAAANSAVLWGADGAGLDQIFYGDTASTNMTWDQSADSLIFNGASRIVWTGTTGQSEIHLTDNLADALSIEISGSTDLLTFTTTNNAESVSPIGLRTRSSTAVAITGATTLTLADSGGIFTVSQAAAYDIDLPSPTTGPGCTYFFSLTAPGANAVTITVAGSAATFVGNIQIDGATIVATGSTLTYASGASSLGDSISVRSIATNLYHVQGVAAAAGGITVA